MNDVTRRTEIQNPFNLGERIATQELIGLLNAKRAEFDEAEVANGQDGYADRAFFEMLNKLGASFTEPADEAVFFAVCNDEYIGDMGYPESGLSCELF